MRENIKRIISNILLTATVLTMPGVFPALSLAPVAEAAFNAQVNYQGKLTDSSNIAVADGSYNMEFKLYTAPSGGSPVWTETLTGANRVAVKGGLFSVMLGSTSPMTNVNFNQALYLTVNIGGTSGSPSWDGEMTPRKPLGAVPAAFEADRLDGISSEQFLRADAANATSTSSTFFSLSQGGSGKIAEFFGLSSNSVLSLLSSGYVGIGTSTPFARLGVAGDAYIGGNVTATGTVSASGAISSASGTSTLSSLSTSALSLGGDYIADITGTGLAIMNGSLVLDSSGNWAGTLNGQTGAWYIANSFSTTSADYWKGVSSFYSTTSSDAWLATKSTTNLAEGTNLYYTVARFASALAGTTTDALAEGTTNLYYTLARDIKFSTTSADYWKGVSNFFSTTSADYWKSQNNFFSTTSVAYWESTQNRWATTSSDYWMTQRNFFSTTSSDAWLATKSTSNLSEGSNLYFTVARVASVIAGTTTDALAEGATNKYYTDARVATYLDTLSKGYFFSTTSADYWKTQNNFYSTTSADYWLAQYNKGFFYSTTSSDAWLATKSTSNLAEGSNLYWTISRFAAALDSTTTDALGEGTTNLYFTNARADARINATSTIGTITSLPNLALSASNYTNFGVPFYQYLSATTTSALAEGTNLYYTVARVAGVIAGTTTDALDEGSANLYFTNARVQAYLDTVAKGYFFSTTSADFWKAQQNFYSTTSADSWLATKTTDDLAQGTTNRYYADSLARAALSSSATGLSYNSSTGVFTLSTGYNIPLTASTTNWNAFYDAPSTRIAAGTGLSWNGNTLNGWATTTSDYWMSQRNFFSTTSSDYWKSVNNFYSTTSADAWLATKSTTNLTEGTNLYYTVARVASVIAGTTTDALAEGVTNKYYTDARVLTYLNTISKGYFFSTTSADYWKTQNNFFSTTSVAYWESTQNRWATTSSDYWMSQRNFFSTTSSDAWLTTKSTTNLAEGTNLYYTVARVASVIAGTTTDALAEGATNKYYTDARVLTYLNTISKGYFYSTTSADYWLAQYNKGFFYSTTSADAWLATKSTTNVSEGTNLYYTDARVNAYVAGSTTIAKLYAGNTWTGANSFNGTLSIGSLTGPLQAINGTVSATGTLSAVYGGTGRSTVTLNQLLIGAAGNTWTQIATSSLNIDLSNTTGILGYTRGGTGLSSVTAAGVLLGNYAGNGYMQLATSSLGLLTTNVTEGTNLYYTDARVNSYVNASTTIPKVYTSNTFTGLQTLNGGLRVSTLNGPLHANNGTVGATTSISHLYGGTGLTATPAYGQILRGTGTGYALVATSTLGIALTDTTGTLAVGRGGTGATTFGYGLVGSTGGTNALTTFATSSLGLLTTNVAEGSNLYYTVARVASVIAGTTTDALAEGATNKYYTDARVLTYLNTISKGYFFSTTSADYWKTQNNFYSTTSADYWLAQYNKGYFFSTTSVAYWETTQNRWATTSSDAWLATKSTTNLAEGANLYYTVARVAAAIAGTTTDALAEGATNKYYTDARVAAYITGSSTLPSFLNYWTKSGNDLAYVGGNIGIGTTSPYAALSVVGDVVASRFVSTTTATSTFGGGLDIATGCFSINGTCLSTGGNGTITAGILGQIAYYSAAGSTLTGTSSVFIDPVSGKVGINNENPNSTLDVSGSLAVSGTSQLAGTTSVTEIDGIGGAAITIGSSANDTFLRSGGTTYVTDASGNKLLTVTASGKVGIGTSTPQTALAMVGNIVVGNSYLDSTATGNIIGDGNATGPFISNVHILGSSNTVNSSFGTAIGHVNDISNTYGTAIGRGNAITNTHGIAIGTYTKASGAYSVAIGRGLNLSNQMEVTADNTFAVGFNSTAPQFVIDGNTNNVGIATTSPYARLSVDGDAVITGSLRTGSITSVSSATSTFSGGISVTGGCVEVDGVCLQGIGGSNGTVYGGSAGQFAFYANNGAAVSGQSSLYYDGGKVGVGTSTPTGLFAISASSSIDSFRVTTDQGAAQFVIDASGNVGIGLGNPSTKLHVAGEITLGTEDALASGSGTWKNKLVMYNGSGSAELRLDTSGFGRSDFLVSNNTDQVFKVMGSTGAVGVGSSTPWAKLSVDAVSGGMAAAFAVGSSTDTHFVVENGGNVAIGTTTASSKLFLSGGSFTHVAAGKPIYSGTYNTPGNSNAAYVSGKYAYVADGSSGLQIVDVSSPASASLVGELDTAGFAWSVAVAGKYAYVAGDTAGLQIINVSDPTVPVLVSTLDTSGEATGIYVSGKYAYVADAASGLLIIDVSNPAAAAVVGTLDTAGSAKSVYVRGRFAYVADGASGLSVIDVSNPASPSQVATLATAGSAETVTVSGDFAYLASGSAGLEIVDVKIPTAPSLAGTYDTADSAMEVSVAGRYAYVSDQTNGFLIIDVADPTAPALVSAYDTPGTALGVTVVGSKAYVSDYWSGLQIFSLNGVETPALYAGAVETSGLSVTENADISNNLFVQGGLNVGLGGILSNGAVTVTENATSTFGGGVNVTGGCIAVNGACLGGSTVNAGTVGQIAYYSANSATISATSSLFLASNGNVGVGSTSPYAKLGVSGDVAAANFIASGGITASGLINGATISGGSLSSTAVNGVTTNTILTAPGANFGVPFYEYFSATTTSALAEGSNLYFTTARVLNSTGWLRSGTNVILGTSTDLVGVGSSTPWAQLGVNAPAGIPSFAVGSTSRTAFIIDKNGNVGIGTVAPSSLLSVVNSDLEGVASASVDASNVNGGNAILSVLSANGNGKLSLVSSTTLGNFLLSSNYAGSANRPLYLAGRGGTTGSNLYLNFASTTIGSANAALSALDVAGGVAIGSYAGANAAPQNGLIVSGSVGIGTTSPFAKLSVGGNAYVDGNLGVSGSFSVSGAASLGSLTLGSALGIGSGGTGLTSVTAAGVLLGNYAGNGYMQLATSSLGLLTTNVAEGSNLYFTNTRVQTYLDTVSKGYFFSSTSADYWDTTRPRWATTSSDYWLTQKTTSDLAEGSNLYFTTARVLNSTGWLRSGTNVILGTSTDLVGVGSSTPWAQLGVNAPAGIPSFAVGTPTNTKFVIGADGKVGIGTAAPASLLDVVNDGIQGDSIGSFNASNVNGGGAALNLLSNYGNSTLSLQASTTLGNFLLSSNYAGSANRPFYLAGRGGTTGSNLYLNFASTTIGSANAALSMLDVAGGVAIGSYAGANAAPQNGLIVSGRLGVGTSNPTTTAHIKNAVSTVLGIEWTDEQTYGGLDFYEGGALRGGIYNIGSNFATLARQNDLELASGNNGDITFNPNGTGKVGVGTTSPSARFSIEALAGANPFAIGSTTSTYFAVNQNGFIGVGTSDPKRKLHIVQNDSGRPSTIVIENVNTTDGAGAGMITLRGPSTGTGAADFKDAAGIYGSIDTHDNATWASSLRFYTAVNGTFGEQMRLNKDGNLGIGIWNPSYKLDVAGTARIHDVLTVSSLVSTSTATSTFGGGLSVTGGCVSVDGVCLGGTTGDWTGTFDGQEGSWYVANSFSTTSADSWLGTKSTTNLAEGSNLYYTDTRVGNYITGSTTLASYLNYWTKSGSNLNYTAGNVGIGTTSPYAALSVVGETVSSYYTATSSNATSTFAGRVLMGTRYTASSTRLSIDLYDTTHYATGMNIDYSPMSGAYSTSTAINLVSNPGSAKDQIAIHNSATWLYGNRSSTGMLNDFGTGYASDVVTGLWNRFNSNGDAWFEGGTAYGVRNEINPANAYGSMTLYGLYNDLAATTGAYTQNIYGSYTIGRTYTGGTKTFYGNYIASGSDSTGGTQYGVYVDLSAGTATKYAGIFNGGNVGIGTTSPYAKLSVVGDVVASHFVGTTTATSSLGGNLVVGSGQTNPILYFGGATSAYPALKRNGTSLQLVSGANDGSLYTLQAGGMDLFGPLAMYTANTQVKFGDGAGAYDVGLVRDAAGVLRVSNGATGGGSLKAEYFTATSTSGTSTLPNLALSRLAFGSDFITDITGSGLSVVGNALSVVTSGDWTGTFDGQEGSWYVANSFSTTSADSWLGTKSTTNLAEGSNLYYTDTRVGNYITGSTTLASYLNYWTKSGSNLSYTDGNVGIGSSTPYAKLSVTGNAVVSDELHVGQLRAFNGTKRYLSVMEDVSSASAVGLSSYMTKVSGALGSLKGAEIEAYNMTSTTTTTSLTGAMVNAYNLSGNVTNLYGLDVYGQTDNGIVGNMFGIRSTVGRWGGYTGNAYAIYADVDDSVTNGYGVYIADISGTSTQYAMYSAGADDSSYFAGKLGIGTTSPYAKLSVVGETVSSYFTATSTNSTSTFAGGLTAGGTSGITVLQNGNVGIGTAAPRVKLEVQGDAYVAGTAWIGGINGISNNINAFWWDTAIAFNTANSGGNYSEKMRISAAGDIGIGTTSPYARLSVWGGSTGRSFEVVNSASTTNLWVSATGFGTTTVTGLNILGSATTTSNVGINLSSGCFSVNGTCVGIGSGTVNSGTQGQISFYNANGTAVSGTSTINISTAGKVGIGMSANNTWGLGVLNNIAVFSTTSVPVAQLYSKSATGAGALYLQYKDYTTHLSVDSGRMEFYNANGQQLLEAYYNSEVNGGGTFALYAANSTSGIYLDSDYDSYFKNGNVGVGTTSPWARLSVAATTTNSTPLFAVAGASNSTKFIVDSNGNVGVGTTTPSARLTAIVAGGGSTQSVYGGSPVGSFSSSNSRGWINTAANSFSALNTSASFNAGLSGVMEDNVSNGGNLYGILGLAVNKATGIGAKDYVIGIGADAMNEASSTVSHLVGLYGTASNYASGTVSNAYGLLVFPSGNYGGGSITNNYGIYLRNQTAGVNNYQIYAEGSAPSYFGGNLGIGTTTSTAKLSILGSTSLSGADAVAGIYASTSLALSTTNGFQFGNRFLNTVTGAATGTYEGMLIRMTDNNTVGNTVRGLEVQAYSGSNTQGVNTGIVTYGKTFGLQATTNSLAGGVATPAAIYADLDNGSAPTSGNAIRAYTDNATSADLVSLYQETSAFTGTGLRMNFGTGGSFTGDFLNLQKSSLTQFLVKNDGTTGIGTTSPYRKLSVMGDGFFAGNLRVSSLTSTSTATSTFGGGINITSGCFAFNGSCISGGGGSGSGTVSSGLQGQLAFYNADGTVVSGTSTMFILPNGNVGIGTTSPFRKLSISVNDPDVAAETIRVINTNSLGKSMVVFENDSGKTLTQGVFGSGFGSGLANAAVVGGDAQLIFMSDGSVENGGTDPITFRVGGYDTTQEVMRLTASGNVGIGTTSPNVRLTVAKDSTGQSNADYNQYGMIVGATGAVGLAFGDFGTYKAIQSFGSTPLALNPAGNNVGVGTTSPAYGRLTVAGDIAVDEYSGYKIGAHRVLYASSTNLATYVGVNAGASLNTSGVDNTAIGYAALSAATSSDDNTAVGAYSMLLTTSGYQNAALGVSTLLNNTSGYQNSALGFAALYGNTTGNNNVGVGTQSLFTNTTGIGNVGVGPGSLYFNSTGSYNTAIGLQAGFGVTGNSYSNNSLFGFQSGYALTTGGNNVLLGYRSGDNLTSGANNIVIGYDIEATSATAANTLNIGNLLFGTGLNGTGTTLSTGNIGIGTTSPSATLSVDARAGVDSFMVGSSTATYFTVSKTGNVGVGTANPSAPLHVNAAVDTMAIFRSTAASPSLYIQRDDAIAGGTSQAAYINYGTTNDGVIWSAGLDTGANGTDDFLFSQGSNVRLTIKNGGNLGIGTTSPYAKLSVAGTAVADNFVATSTTATSTFAGGFSANNGAIVSDFSTGVTTIDNLELGSLSFEADSGMLSWVDMPVTAGASAGTVQSYTAQLDGNSLLTVYGESDGLGGIQNSRVGIGTTTPRAKLYVSSGTTGDPLSLGYSGSGAALDFVYEPNMVVTGRIENVIVGGDTTSLAFQTYTSDLLGRSEKMRITGAGNVGIGTTSPYAKLSVVGDVVASRFVSTTTATSTFGGGIDIATGCFSVNGTCISGGTGGSGTVNSGTQGQIAFYNANGAAVSGTSSIQIGQNQNVGIGGAADTSAKLAVTGNTTLLGDMTLADNDPTQLVYEMDAAVDNRMWTLGVNNGAFALQSTNDTLALFDPFFVASRSGASTTNVMLATNDWTKVSVGASTTPFAKLSVNSTAGIPAFVVGSSTATSFIVDKNGNVAIGTTTAGLWNSNTGTTLSLFGASSATLEIASSPADANGTSLGQLAWINGGSTTWISDRRAAYIDVLSDGTTAGSRGGKMNFNVRRNGSSAFDTGMTIAQGGLVGMGTTSPTGTGRLVIQTVSTAGEQNALTLRHGGSLINDNVAISLYPAGAFVTQPGKIVATAPGSNNVGFNFVTNNSGTSNTAMSILPTGLVGIGTTTPTNMLTVSSASAPQLTLSAGAGIAQWAFRNAGGNLYFATTTVAGNATSSVAALTITNGGLVGIGTTTPGKLLAIEGSSNTAGAFGTSNVGIELRNNSAEALSGRGSTITFNGSHAAAGGRYAAIDGIVTGSGAGVGQIGSLVFSTKASTADTTLVERMRIDNNGNVGVGTSSPWATLSVQASSTNATVFNVGAANGSRFLTVANAGFGTTTLSGLNISGSATSTSNVGFNITSGCYAVNGTCVGGSGSGSGTVNSGLQGQLAFYNANGTAVSGTSTVTVAQSGFVGIGTTSPAYALDVARSATTGTYGMNVGMYGASSGNMYTLADFSTYGVGTQQSQIALGSNGVAMAYFGQNGSQAFVDASHASLTSLGFKVNGTEAGRFTSGGSLAIGTTTSTAKLSVTGMASGNGGDNVAAIYASTTLSLSANGGFGFGNRLLNTVTGSATGTFDGMILRMTDNTTNNNTVRGLEVQAWSGTNTSGVNTGIATFGKTFGIQATTDALAGSQATPAAVFADLDNGSASTAGNAIRAYTDNATSADLVSFYQETSAFTGSGLKMNFGTGGSFTGYFLALQKSGTNKFLVDHLGRTAIGTTSIGSMLDVASSTSSSNVDIFRVVSNVGGTGNVKFRIDSDGDVFSDGTNNLGGGADLAENYRMADGAEAGEIVAISSGTSAVRASVGYQSNVLGVVSTKPALVIGGVDEDADAKPDTADLKPVALSGRVPVKVSNENGEVFPGDYLTTSAKFPGYAMKATRSGNVIGQALTPFAGDVTASSTGSFGEVEMFVKLGYQYIGNTMTFGEYEALAAVSTGSDCLSSEACAAAEKGDAFTIDQKGSGSLIRLQKNGSDKFIVDNAGSVKILASTDDKKLSLLTVANNGKKLFAIDASGNLVVTGKLTVGGDTAGTATVTAGNNTVRVTFAEAYDTVPKVVVTFQGAPDFFYGVAEKGTDGFTIKTSKAMPSDAKFDWVALAVDPQSSQPKQASSNDGTSQAQTAAYYAPAPAASGEPAPATQTASVGSAAASGGAENGSSEPEQEPAASEPVTAPAAGQTDAQSDLGTLTVTAADAQNPLPAAEPVSEPEPEAAESPAPAPAPASEPAAPSSGGGSESGGGENVSGGEAA